MKIETDRKTWYFEEEIPVALLPDGEPMGNIIIGAEDFIAWVRENSKRPDDVQPGGYLDDLDTRYCETGSPHYEMSRWETNSGHPEIYDYTAYEGTDTEDPEEASEGITIFDLRSGREEGERT